MILILQNETIKQQQQVFDKLLVLSPLLVDFVALIDNEHRCS